MFLKNEPPKNGSESAEFAKIDPFSLINFLGGHFFYFLVKMAFYSIGHPPTLIPGRTCWFFFKVAKRVILLWHIQSARPKTPISSYVCGRPTGYCAVAASDTGVDHWLAGLFSVCVNSGYLQGSDVVIDTVTSDEDDQTPPSPSLPPPPLQTQMPAMATKTAFSEEDDDPEPDGEFTFRRKRNCSYLAVSVPFLARQRGLNGALASDYALHLRRWYAMLSV